MTKNIIIPEIDNKFEKFDIDTFEKERKGKKRIKIQETVLIEEDSYTLGYIRREYNDSSYFKLNKKFYKNTFVKEKGIMFNNGSQYGVWYQFNEAGKLIQEIDTDAGYTYTWEEVIQYCHNNKIPLTKGYKASGSQTGIYKREEDGKKAWVIEYLTAKEDDVYSVELTLDGTTGKELKRREAIFDGH